MALFGFGKEKELTYKVNLDTQSMQQQMQQMQFQQQAMMMPPNQSFQGNYASEEALRNFAMAQQAQYMGNMDYAELSFRERMGLAATRTITQGAAIAGGALATGLSFAEFAIPGGMAASLGVMGAGMATEKAFGQSILPSALVGTAVAQFIEGTTQGAAEAFQYKQTLNIADRNNLLTGGGATAGYKNELASYMGEVGSYFKIQPHQMTGILSSAIDNELIDTQDLEKTKENVFKLTRSLTESTKILYESLDMIDKTIQDFKNYAIFNSKPETMVETASFLKSVSNLTGHSISEIIQTTESLSNAFTVGTAMTPGSIAPLVAQGIGNVSQAYEGLSNREQRFLINSGGYEQVYGRMLAQINQSLTSNPSMFPVLTGLNMLRTGEVSSLQEGMNIANAQLSREFGAGGVGRMNAYAKESLAYMANDSEAFAGNVRAYAMEIYGGMINSGQMSFQDAIAMALRDLAPQVDQATAAGMAPTLMRMGSSRAQLNEDLQELNQANTSISTMLNGPPKKSWLESVKSFGQSFGRGMINFFAGDPNDRAPWFATQEVGSALPEKFTASTRESLLRTFSLSAGLRTSLETSANISDAELERLKKTNPAYYQERLQERKEAMQTLQRYEQARAMLNSSNESDMRMGAENMAWLYYEQGWDMNSAGKTEETAELHERYSLMQKAKEQGLLSSKPKDPKSLTGQQRKAASKVIQDWAKKYMYSSGDNADTHLNHSKKLEILRDKLGSIAKITPEALNILMAGAQEQFTGDLLAPEVEVVATDSSIGTVNPSMFNFSTGERVVYSQEEQVKDRMTNMLKPLADRSPSAESIMNMLTYNKYTLKGIVSTVKYKGIEDVALGTVNPSTILVNEDIIAALKKAGVSDEAIDRFKMTGEIVLSDTQRDIYNAAADASKGAIARLDKMLGTKFSSVTDVTNRLVDSQEVINMAKVNAGMEAIENLANYDLDHLVNKLGRDKDYDYTNIRDIQKLVKEYHEAKRAGDKSKATDLSVKIANIVVKLTKAERDELEALGINLDDITSLVDFANIMDSVMDSDKFSTQDQMLFVTAGQKAVREFLTGVAQGAKIPVGDKLVEVQELLAQPDWDSKTLKAAVDYVTSIGNEDSLNNLFYKNLTNMEVEGKTIEEVGSDPALSSFERLHGVLDFINDDFVTLGKNLEEVNGKLNPIEG